MQTLKNGICAVKGIKALVKHIGIKKGKKDLGVIFSEEICSERVDHSVIHYWEKKLEEVYTAFVKRIGQLLSKLTRPMFRIIDSTKFATWKQKEIEFHTLTAITKKTVFPTSVFFGSVSPSKAVNGVLPKGKGELMCDRWYDDNKAMGIMFERA